MADIDLEKARAITAAKEEQYGLPSGTLFKIGGIESSFRGNAVSPKGAKGYFQFMDPTAKTYGVTVGDFESEADGAARYMRDNLKKYNGNLDLSLADYNGGPKAAMALAKGKPWAETSDYLSKFYGRTGYTPISSQFTTGESISPTASPSASQLYKEERQRDAEYGGFVNGVANLPSAIATGFQLDNSVYNLWKQTAISNMDPNFQMTEDFAKELLDGIPQKHWEYVLQAKSAQEANDRRARTMDALQKEQELSKMGVTGFAGRLVGGLADIPTLIALVPGFGGEGLLTAGSRIANAVRLGLVGAGTNVAFDYSTMSARPLATIDDLYISAAMGLGLGGLGGAAASLEKVALRQEMVRLRDFGLSESMRTQVAEFRRYGLDLTEQGRALYERQKAAGVVADDVGVNPRVYENLDPDRYTSRKSIQDVETPVISAKVQLESLLNKLDKGEISEGRFQNEIRFLKNRLEEKISIQTDKRSVKERERGAAWVEERLLRAKRKGEIDPDAADFAIWAVRKYPHLANDLGISLKAEGNGSSGRYNPASKVFTLFKDSDKFDTGVHEILHHSERMLPPTLQKKIADEWAGRLAKEIADARKAGNTERVDLLTKMLEGAAGSQRAANEIMQAFKDGKLKYEDYQFFNSSEFWAVNASRYMESKYSANSWIAKTRNFLKDIYEKIRSALGLSSDAPIIRGLNSVLKSDGEFRSKKMLSESKFYNDYAPTSQAISEADAIAASKAEISPVFGWGLGLENRLASEKVPQSVRNLASKLFGTTIGYKDHSVVRANAWDDTTKWADSWAVEMRKGTYPQFEDWFKQSGKKWTEKGAAFEDFGTQVSNYIRGIDGEYAPQVIKAGDQMRKTLAKVVDYINNPLHDEGGSKRGLTMQEVRDPETGEVTLVGGLDKNPNYLPRKHDVNKWNTLVQTYGRDAIEGWWARAHKAGREGISDEQAAKFGKWYVRTVEEAHANRTQDLLDDLFRGQDLEALKASLKINGGFTDSEVLKIVDDLFPTQAKDTGRTMSSLKNRNTIDERYTETWTMPDGTKVEVGLNNFVHSNAFDIVEPYLRRTAGSVAMAKHLDVYKVGDIDRLIADATENKLGSEFKTRAEVDRMRKDLQFAFDRIQGLPLEEFAWWRKGLEMWRNFNVIRLMGGAVWNQATEMSQIIGTMGWKTTLQAIPELRALRRDLATGKAPNEILEHLENTIGGVGSEYVARMEFGHKDDWVRNMGDTKMNRWLDAADTGVNKLARGVLDYTGMTPLMIQQKRVHAVALVNHFVNTANGKASSFLTKDRLAWMGLDEAMTSRLMENLKKYSKPTKGQYAETFKMDFAKWVKEDPESHSAFMNAIHRESRRVVQENDLASMIPLMGSTLGKTVFQFMNFSMHGWNKSLMFAANHRDWSTLSTVLHGSMLASLAYMGRTAMSAAGMDDAKKREFLDQRMSAQQIVANSFGRISQMSLLPNIYDTLSPYPLFQGMRTTSDLSSLASNPTYQAINGLLSMKKIIRNGLSDEYQTTAQDVRAWGKLVPLNNVFPISTLLNSIANDYPTSEKE